MLTIATTVAAIAGFALGLLSGRRYWTRQGACAALRMWRDITERRT